MPPPPVQAEPPAATPPALSSRRLAGLILIYGALTLAAQVLILREVLVLAQGQELKLGLALWCWLLCTGLGSLFGGRVPVRPAGDGEALGGLILGLALLLPATLLLLRALPALGLVPVGQAVSLFRSATLFLALLAPFGLLSGAFFPLACQAVRCRYARGTGGRVYALEALGAAAGVAAVQVLLWGRVSSLALGLGVVLAALLSLGLLVRPRRPVWSLPVWLAAAVLTASLFWTSPLDFLTRGWQFPGRRLLAAVDSPHALLSATREAEQVSFAANGVWHFTWPDPYTAEQAVQLALLAHPEPRRVLLLGGGVAGLVPEILKTRSVARLDYVEADPELVRLASGLLPPEATGPLHAPGVQVIFADPRRLVDRPPASYDVVLMHLPPPSTAQLNRFYSQEFFAAVSRCLAPGGVFSFGLAGSPAVLSPLRAALLASLSATLAQVFPQVLALPGEQVRFLASPTPGTLTADPQVLAARLAARDLGLVYLDPYTLETEFSRERREFLARALAQAGAEVNRDLLPRSLFYETALTGSLEGVGLELALTTAKRLPAWVPALAWLTAGLFCWGVVRRRPRSLPVLQVAMVGAGALALEILALLVFQIYLGYLYRQLGLLIAACMLGLAAGGAWGVRQAGGPGRLPVLQAVQALLVGAAAGALAHLPLGPHQGVYVAAGTLLVLTAGGFTAGGVFALAAAHPNQSPGRGAEGSLYAADLLGATLGALSVSLLVLPVWGVLPALAGVAALHGLAALLAWAAPAA